MPIGVEELADFESLFHQHWSRVYGVIFRLVGDRNEAESLASEVFFRLYSDAESGRPVEYPEGWLYRSAVNAGLNQLRAAQRRARYENEAGRRALAENGQPPSPEIEAIRTEEREQVRTVLAAMRPRSARLLILRYSGLSYAEVAGALGIAPTSVGTLLARAEQEFVRSYQDLLPETERNLPLPGE